MQHSACFGQSFTLSKKRGGWKIQRPKPAQPFWKTTHNIHLQKDKVRLTLMYTGRYWGNSIHNRSFKLSHFYALLWGRGQKCNSCRLPRDNSIFFGCRSLHPKYQTTEQTYITGSNQALTQPLPQAIDDNLLQSVLAVQRCPHFQPSDRSHGWIVLLRQLPERVNDFHESGASTCIY